MQDSINPLGNSSNRTSGPSTGAATVTIADGSDGTGIMPNSDVDTTLIQPLSSANDSKVANDSLTSFAETTIDDQTDKSAWSSEHIIMCEMILGDRKERRVSMDDFYGNISSSCSFYEYASSLYDWQVVEEQSQTAADENEPLEQKLPEENSLDECVHDGDADDFTWIAQAEDPDKPVALELLPGYAMVDSENYMSCLNVCLREYYSVLGRHPSKYCNMVHYPPTSPAHSESPPYLFIQSRSVSDDMKQVLLNCRLNHDMTAEQLTRFLYDFPSLGASFFQPKFPSVPNSINRTLEIRRWDDPSFSGFKIRKIDPLLLNILKHSEHPLVDSFWTRVSDVIDSYPSPTVEEPLPIAQAHLGKVEDLSKHQYLLPKFAQKEFLDLIKREMERVQNEYGPLNQLQTEEANVNFSALLGLFQLFECSARGDLVGRLDIIKAARKCLQLLQALFQEDYGIREDAVLTFPLFDRDFCFSEEVSDINTL